MQNLFLNSSSLEDLSGQVQSPLFYQMSFPMSDTLIKITNNVNDFIPLHVKIFNSNTFPVIFSTQNGSGMPYIIQPNQLKSINITGFENDTYVLTSQYTSNSQILLEFFSYKDYEYAEPVEVYTQATGIQSVSVVNTPLPISASQSIPVSIVSANTLNTMVINTVSMTTSQVIPVSISSAPTLSVSQVNYTASYNVISLSSNASYTNTYSYTATKNFELYQTASVSGFSTYLIANSHTANITALANISLSGYNTYTLEVVSTSQSTATNYQAIINIV